MDEPLRAHSFNEVRYYLMVCACEDCGKGPHVIDAVVEPSSGSGQPLAVRTHCKDCGDEKTVSFLCDSTGDPNDPDTEVINPTDEPSGIIDLGQWFSLFYLLIEKAAGNVSRPEARRLGYRAALCLTEALKFYRADEEQLPPESAFFAAERRSVFQHNPEKYARQRLRDMQSKLPAISHMAKRVAQDAKARKHKWWQFWK